MKKLIVLATFAASALIAACEHGAPQPGPREVTSMSSQPTPVESAPAPAGTPNAATNGDPTSSEARPSSEVPTDAGVPLPGKTPTPVGNVNPGPSAMNDKMFDTQRNLHSDDDLHLLPPAQRMPISNVPAQPMPVGPGITSEQEPSSVKPDGGILYDGGAPLPPVPDGGPLPGTRDASVPL